MKNANFCTIAVSFGLRYCVITHHKLNAYNKAHLIATAMYVQTRFRLSSAVLLQAVLTWLAMISVYFSFHKILHYMFNEQRKWRELKLIGKGQVIIPFYAATILKTIALKRTKLSLQDLGLKNKGCLKLNAILAVFHRQSSTQTLQVGENYMKESPSTSYKRPASTRGCIPVEHMKRGKEWRLAIIIYMASYICIFYIYNVYCVCIYIYIYIYMYVCIFYINL